MHPHSSLPRTAFLSLAVAALLSGCGDSTAPNNGPAEVVVTAVDTLRSIGATATLTAVVRNARHEVMTEVAVSGWESSNPAVVTVNATTGLATAVANGTATITAHAGPITGTTTVIVLQAPVSVTLVPPTDTLRALGATGQYTVVAKDAGGSIIAAPVMSWSSTNPAVVAVGPQGLATAVSNGSAYVRGRSGVAIDSLPLAVLQRVDPTKSTLSVVRPLLFVDDTVRVTLQGRDALSNPLPFGGATVVFSSSGGTSTGTFRPVVDNQNGTYSADFIGVSRGSILTIGASIDGAAVISAMPLRVVGFTKIVASGSTVVGPQGTNTGGYTCGIITTGEMYCWGIAWDGIRGNGLTSPYGPGPGPTLVGGEHQWTDVAAGAWYVCAVATGGGVYCWGDGGDGQLGNGSKPSIGYVSYPTPISGSSTFGAVSIGLIGGTCAITLTKAAMCWGFGIYGRLGNGGDTLATAPVPVSGGLSFDGLHTTINGTCGIAAGSAYCWGYSSLLGAGGSAPDICAGPSNCAKTPVAVSGGHVFRPIVSIDGNVVCAVATDDQTYCWGSGYLGNGTTGIAVAPTVVSGGLSFTSLTASDQGHCGTVVGGAAYCWGGNRNGRLGNGTTTDAVVPTAVSGGHAFTQLSSSQDHVCGVATDGNAYCWGGNDMGELGTRSQTASHVPVRVRLFSP